MTPEGILAGIRDANYHRGGIRCRRLLRAEATFLARLQGDVARLRATQQPSDVTRPEHVTHWTAPFGQVAQYSLLNRTGQYDDFSTDHDLSCWGKRFHEPDEYPSLAQLIDVLPHAVNVRINVMGGHAGLSPHEEHSIVRTRLGTVAVRARFHLPLETNDGAELLLDGNVYHLDLGVVAFVNHGCVHSAQNDSDEPRVHLVWDLLLTREAFEAMFGDGAAPTGFRRVPADERELSPRRTQTLGEVRRLQPQVSQREAAAVAFFESQ